MKRNSIFTNFRSKALLLLLLVLVPSSAQGFTSEQLFRVNGDQSYFIANDTDCVAGAGNGAAGVSGATTLVGSDQEAQAYNFFVQKGLTSAQSAGIVGNFIHESHLNPASVQPDGDGRGLAQWDKDDRWLALQSFAAASTPPRSHLDFGVQLEFAWHELETTEGRALTGLRTTTTPEEAADNFDRLFERSDRSAIAERQGFARAIFTKYGGGTPVGVSGVSGTALDAGATGIGCPNPSAAIGPGVAGAGVVAGNIVATAMGLAWPDNLGPNSETAPHPFSESTPAYQTAWNGASNQTDCGAFVSTVMVTSGVDPDYPPVGTAIQKAYLLRSTDKYTIVPGVSSSAQLVPGDILTFNNGGPTGHTLIYTGPQAGGFVKVDASLGDHTPEMGSTGSLNWMLGQPNLVVARKK